MDATAKRELANAIRKVSAIREASYIKGTFRYGLDFYEAAERAEIDPDLAPLVIAMLQAGYADFPEWADRILAKVAA